MNKRELDKKYGSCCHRCTTEAECACNDWLLYDPYNKKCPNWREGVKQYHKYIREYNKGWW